MNIRLERAVALVLSICFLPASAATQTDAAAPATHAPQMWASASDIYPNLGWSTSTALPAPRWAHAMAAFSFGSYPVNDVYLYVISGADGAFANTAALSRYDVAQDQWGTLASMPTSRQQISAVCIGSKIYVPGGYASSFAPVSALSIYDIGLDQWQTGAAMPQATGDYAIGAYADRYIYVIGGYSGAGDLNTVQVYDTVMNAWQTATAKPGSAVAGLRGGIVGNRIVVVGGYSQVLAATLADGFIGTIDPADPTLIAWEPIAPYPGGPSGRFGAGVPVAAGPAQGSAGMNVVVFTSGDPNGQGTSVRSDTWIYDLNSASWRSGPDKPSGVSNIDNLAGFSSNGALRIAATGGYNGSAVIAANEWLTLGYEAPPDLAISIDDGGSAVDPGSVLAYSLMYTVGAPGTAQDVAITETVPVRTTFDAAASTPGWVCAPDDSAGSTCTFSLGDLVAGASGSVLFAVDVPSPGPDQIADHASIAMGAVAFGPEQNLANNTAVAVTANSTRIFADGFEP